ncbi:hypothetical protein HMPREF0673_00335 [Leyella stercorea DSM 18206]|uniref:Uncharacterized protein n=1 Tax=Leyella stercorea DSM 18206 TaxID=1002367 RepID=G6AUQ0_9BACT|nr:hypothetical protein HMPREF0673_00335 [Leyella stercorea DSM 18206]
MYKRVISTSQHLNISPSQHLNTSTPQHTDSVLFFIKIHRFWIIFLIYNTPRFAH